ncbi:hypothetical protein Tco_0916535 [Tanacetum coccineum]
MVEPSPNLAQRLDSKEKMIEEKIENTKAVRLRGLEKRKEKKECLQEVRNTKVKGGLDINALALSDRHPTYHKATSEQVKKDDPNITMEEYIRLEEEKTRRLAIVFNDTLTSEATLSCEPMVSSLNNNKIDFRILFDEFDDKDCTLPQHIDEFNLKDETSLSECDEEEQNVLNFNDLFPFNVLYLDDLKLDKDNDDDKIDIEHSLGDLSVKPLPDVINTDVGAFAHGSNKLLKTSLSSI